MPDTIAFVQTPPPEVPVPVNVTIVAGVPPVPADIPTDSAQYLGYGAIALYEWDYGLRGAPVAGPKGALLSFVRLHGGAGLKTISAVAIRLGERPKLPHWDTQSPNEVLFARRVACFSPAQFPDGTPVYAVVQELYYMLQQAPGDDDQLDFLTSPIGGQPVALNFLAPSDFSKYLSGPAQAVAGFGGGPITF
jgi:hypothetical protein